MKKKEHQHRWVMFCRYCSVKLDTVSSESNAAYIRWINGRWQLWDQINNHAGPHTMDDNADFDTWLLANAPQEPRESVVLYKAGYEWLCPSCQNYNGTDRNDWDAVKCNTCGDTFDVEKNHKRSKVA